jgi:type I restriction enzyme S subunit
MSTVTLQIEKKKTLVPQLRFQEFDGEWEKKTMFDISSDVSYGMNAAATTFDGIHKYLRITDIDSESRKFKPNPLTSPEGIIDKKFKLKKNDLLFTRTGASVGKSYLYDEKDGNLYYAGFLIKFNISSADSYFVYSLTLKESYDKWVHVYSMRSGQPGLNAEEYKELKLNLPTLPEQQKIASFLSAVDEKIQQLTRKAALLEQYKKGVMQQLFSGKLRFKDEKGKDYPDWEEKKLGDIGTIVSGLTYSPDDIHEEGVLVLRSSNVQNRKLSFQDNVYVKTSVFNSVELNDILICVRNGSKNLIGKNTIINKETVGVAFGAFMSVYRSNYNLFLFHYFDTDDYKNEVHKNLGATINSINGSDLKKFKVPFPCIEEQQKIANFLSGIDSKIENVNQQLAQTQTFKKGLLQQLFV